MVYVAIGIMLLLLSIVICIWVKAIEKVDYSDPKTQMCINCECIWCTKNPDECFKEKENTNGR